MLGLIGRALYGTLFGLRLERENISAAIQVLNGIHNAA